MELVELTEDTWPALETLFGANKTVGWVSVAPRANHPRLTGSKVGSGEAEQRGTRRALVRKEVA